MCISDDYSNEDIMQAAADIIEQKLVQVEDSMTRLESEIDWDNRGQPELREAYDQAWMLDQQLTSFPIIVDFFKGWWDEPDE